MSLLLKHQSGFISRRANRNTHGVLRGPSGFKSSSDSRNSKIVGFGPLMNQHSLPKRGDRSIPSCVSSLFRRCSPSHVTRFIISVHVRVAINRMNITGGLSHVFKEFLNVQPFGVKRNPTASVVMKFGTVGVQCASFHTLPDLIQTSAAQSMLAMPSLAAAARNQSSFEFTSFSDIRVTAITNAVPRHAIFISMAETNSGQRSKLLTERVKSVWSRSISLASTARNSGGPKVTCRAITIIATVANAFPYNSTSVSLRRWLNTNKIAKTLVSQVFNMHEWEYNTNCLLATL